MHAWPPMGSVWRGTGRSKMTMLLFTIVCLMVTRGGEAADLGSPAATLFVPRREYLYAYNSTALLPDSVSQTLCKVRIWVVTETAQWQELHVSVADVKVGQSHQPLAARPLAPSQPATRSGGDDEGEWFSVKRDRSGSVEEVKLGDGHSVSDLTKLKLTIAQLFNFDTAMDDSTGEPSARNQGTYAIKRQGDTTTLTKTMPPSADDSGATFTHLETTTLTYSTATETASSVLSEERYSLQRSGTQKQHPVPSQLQVTALHNLTLLSVEQRRHSDSSPDNAVSHTPRDVLEYQATEGILASLQQCLKRQPVAEDCDELLSNGLRVLTATQLHKVASDLAKDASGMALDTFMSGLVRSPSSQSQVACAKLLLPVDTKLFTAGFDTEQLLQDAMFHWAGLISPQKELVDGLIRSCLTEPNVFVDDSLRQQCQLTLGSLARTLITDQLFENQARGRTLLELLHSKLDSLLDVPGSCWRQEDHVLSVLHAVGHTGQADSFTHMQKAIDSSECSPKVQHAAVQLMVKLPHDKVRSELVRLAESESHHRRVREVAQEYVDGESPDHDSELHRAKRQASGGSSTPVLRQYHSASPSVQWHNQVGSKDVGASFGSSTTSNISQTVGYYGSTVNIDIESKSWVQGQLGYINRRSDLLEVTARATGSLTYNRDIMKDYQFGRVQSLANRFDTIYSELASNLSASLQSLVARSAAAGQAQSLSTVFSSPIAMLSTAAQARADLHRDLLLILQSVSQHAGNASAPVTDVMQHLVTVYDLWEAVSLAMDYIYRDTIVQSSTDLPYIAAEWANSVDGMAASLAQLHSNPQQALSTFNIFNIRLRAYIKDCELLLRRFQTACRRNLAANCSVFLSSESRQLSDATANTNFWISQLRTALQGSTDSGWVTALNSTLRQLEGGILPWLGRVTAQVTNIQSSLRIVMQTIATVQSESLIVNQAMEQAGGEWVRIAGLDFHHRFPNRLRPCDSVCGCSQFPFTAGGNFPAGIPLTATLGSEIVAPLNCIVRPGPTNTSLLFQPVGLSASFMEIVLYNIVPTAQLLNVSLLVQAGTVIGSVIGHSQCGSDSGNFLHVVARSVSSPLEIMDPSQFLSDSSRGAIVGEEWTSSSIYTIFIRNERRRSSAIRESLLPRSTDINRRSQAISTPALATGSSTPPMLTPNQTALSIQLATYNFYRSIAMPTQYPLIDSLWPALNTDLADVIASPQPVSTLASTNALGEVFTVGELRTLLTQSTLDSSTAVLDAAMSSLTQQRSQLTCEHLPTASSAHLRQTLALLGVANTGNRQELLTRLQGASNNECSGLRSGIPSGSRAVYQFGTSCNSGVVCFDIVSGFESRTMTFAFQQQPAAGSQRTLTISLGSYSEAFTVSATGLVGVSRFTNLMIDGKEIHVQVSVPPASQATTFVVFLCNQGGLACGTAVSHTLLSSANLASSAPAQANASAILTWPVGQLQAELAFHQLATPSVSQIFTDMYLAVIGKASSGRSSALPAFLNEFRATSRSFTSSNIQFSSGLVNFFEEQVSIQVGLFPLTLVFGASGYVNVSIFWSLDASNYRAVLNVNPSIDMATYGRVRMGSSQFAEASLSGQLVNVQYASHTESNYGPLPLTSRTTINETLLGGRIVLATRLTENQINGGQRDLSRRELWDQVTIPQTYELQREHVREDNTPPLFYPLLAVTEPRPPTTNCTVTQVPQRAVGYPAFQLSLSVVDEDSRVESVQYYVGLAPSASDAIQRQPLLSPVVLVPRILAGGVPLYFTVEVGAVGNKSVATCMLRTYDITLPQGHVIPSSLFTSHPNEITSVFTYWDDSSLWPVQWRAAGFEGSVQGRDIVQWEQFSTTLFSTAPTGGTTLDQFAQPQTGQLVATPMVEYTGTTLLTCASQCVALTTCHAFDHSAALGMCRLLRSSRTSTLQLATVQDYQHYARLGNGYAAQHRFTGLALQHAQTFYVNVILRNRLGHAAVLSSPPLLLDLTPPSPGMIGTPLNDTLVPSGCSASYAQRCYRPTPIPNHRVIVDSSSSQTVFNGHSPLTELLYTHVNNYISAHWNGFSDPETGVWTHTWCVGSSVGGCDVVSRRNPHVHLSSASAWTNSGLAGNLDLADGIYFVTVQALNGAVYGGSLVTTVQHGTGLVVDSTPPIIHSVSPVLYASATQQLTFTVNASDTGSGLSTISYGLGRSSSDVLIQDWRSISLVQSGAYQVTTPVPDGANVWVRVQVGNRAGLLSTGSASAPFSVDTSPPSRGRVFDGSTQGEDSDFQASPTMICANWVGFADVDSGLSHFLWAINTSNSAFNAALPSPTRLPPTSSGDCTAVFGGVPDGATVYSTITAVHASTQQLSSTSTSDGVLVDTSPPTRGQVQVGTQGVSSGQFWSLTHQLSAFWSGFNDSESGIRQYHVSLLRAPATMAQSQARVVSTTTVPATQSSYDCYSHQWEDGDQVRVQVAASSGALLNTSASSQFVTVDSSPPVILSLLDGLNPNQDQRFVNTNGTLSANWQAEDRQSGVVWYEVSIQQLRQGNRMQVWPAPPASGMQLTPNITNFTTPSVSLDSGSQYTVALSVRNGAGLLSHAETDGVIVDTVPPTVQNLVIHSSLPLGLQAVATDVNGHIVISNAQSLAVSFTALDSHSGIASSRVGILDNATGTFVGARGSVGGLVDFGRELSGYLEQLSLQVGDAVTGPLYQVQVETEDNAGLRSNILRSALIRVVSNDTAGVVLDGGDPATDTDYQRDDTALTATFRDFQTRACDIEHVLWVASTRRDDPEALMAFRQDGLTVTGTQSRQASGRIHWPMAAMQGQTYFITVRVVTACGTVLQATSDGVLVDRSPPTVTVASLGGSQSSDTPTYTTDPTASIASWQRTDGESPIPSTQVSIGSYPGGGDIMAAQSTEAGRLQRGQGLTGYEGLSRYVTITATNGAGATTQRSSDPVVVDTTPPTAGTLTCEQSLAVSSSCTLTCTWPGFQDTESALLAFDLSLGRRAGDQDVFGLVRLPIQTTRFTFSGLQCSGGESYYATLRAINSASLPVSVFGSAVRVDNTPPTSGTITVRSNHARISLAGTGASDVNASCLIGATRMTIYWAGFEDSESGLARYSVGLGTSPLSDNVRPFADVPLTSSQYTFTGLNATALPSTLIYATVRAQNTLKMTTGSSSTAIVFVDRQQGQQSLLVGDGRVEAHFQVQTSSINATWQPSNTSCAASLQWKITSLAAPSSVEQQYVNVTTNTSTGVVRLANNNLALSDGYTYRVIVRAVDIWGTSREYQSRGVGISASHRLQPGQVSDGPYQNVDINYQLSLSEMSATWTEFGDSTAAGQVESYWVAIGTDRRYPATRTNVMGYLSVGRNTSYTAYNLSLTRFTVRYYVTVRAMSRSGAGVEATSNGVLVGYAATVTAGQVTVTPSEYQSNNSTMQATWQGFSSPRGIVRYEWSVSSSQLSAMDLLMACNASTFGLRFRSAGLNTRVSASGLSLLAGVRYFMVVRAIDQSQDCTAAQSNGVVLDLTPATAGRLVVGYDTQALPGQLTYIRSRNVVTVAWSGFTDDTSGIDHYRIALFSLRNCSDPTSMDPSTGNGFGTFYRIGLKSSYAFTGVSLVADRSHVVQLQAVNKAQLVTTTTSSPFLVGTAPAVAGEVHDGADWTSDRVYQNSSSDVWVSFTHVNQVTSAVPCRRVQSHPLVVPSLGWTALSGSLSDVGAVQKLLFVPTLVSHNSSVGTSLRMLGNLSSDRVDSAAYRSAVNLVAGGNVSFEIRTAQGDESLANHSIFGVVLWLGDDVSTTDYTSVRTPASRAASVVLSRSSQAVGLQIHPAYDGNSSRLLAWSRHENDTSQVESVWYNLAFDPSASFHRYRLAFKTSAVTALWTMNVFVDDTLVITMAGIPPLRRQTSFVAQLWNRNNFVPLRQASPREVTAHIRNVQFPNFQGVTCDYGVPFYGTQSPIVSYEAAVGTSPGATDVQSYQVVASPCRACPPGPCQSAWSACNASCATTTPEILRVQLSGLDLSRFAGNRSGELVCTSRTECSYDRNSLYASQPTFFVTVRATNGAGHVTVATTDGVKVDQTPPVLVRRPQHFDVDFSLSEAVVYQSSNSTIYASWRLVDLESDVVEYEWAIGTTAGGTDLQDFTSVGLRTEAANSQLVGSLQHNGEYFATVRARNGAGLQSVSSSTGVVLITTSINQTQAQAAVKPLFITPARRPSNVTIEPYTQAEEPEHVGISWEGVNADVVYWRIGTAAGRDDILPSTRISGQNITDQMASVTNATLLLGNISIANISELTARAQGRAEQASDNFFRLEPGRVYNQRLDICNLAFRCTEVNVAPSIVFRPSIDNLVTGVANQVLILNISQRTPTYSVGPLSAADAFQHVTLNATVALAVGDSLATGLLSSESIQQRYTPTVSFISNPVNTSNQASRQLTGRFVSLAGPSFYVTPISSTGLRAPLPFVTSFDAARNWNGHEVVVLFWNYESSRWQYISDSCGLEPVVNWTDGTIRGQICSGNVSVATPTQSSTGRVRRQTSATTNYLNAEMQLIVAQIVNGTVNTRPRLVFTQTQPYPVAEDAASVTIDLSASVIDNENDIGVFSLSSVPARGNASITPAGVLTYTPCRDCVGMDQVTVTFAETQQEALPPYTTSSTFSFTVANDNDQPSAFLFTRPPGSRTIHSSTILQSYAEANHSTPLLVARFGLYDYDGSHDNLSYLVETSRALQGSLSVELDFQGIGASTSMPVDWPANSTAMLFSGELLFSIANITYTPPSLDFIGTETFSVYARDSESFLSSPQLTITIEVLPSYCQNGGQCSHSPADANCSDTAARRSRPQTYTCQCPVNYAGQHCEINSTVPVAAGTGCPASSPLMRCDANPCDGAVCPGQDTAVCRPNYCGGCRAEWFVGSTQVQCSANVSSVCSVPQTQTVADISFCLTQAQTQPCECPMEQVTCPPDAIYTLQRIGRCCVRYTCQCVSSMGTCPSRMNCGTGLQPQPSIRGHQQPGWCCPVYTYDDIDECGIEDGGCSHTCVNSLYSHSCTCPTGMNLHPDGKTCGVCYAGGSPYFLGDHAYVGQSWCTCIEDNLNHNRWYCARDHTDPGCEYNGRRYAIGQQISFFGLTWQCTQTDDVIAWRTR